MKTRINLVLLAIFIATFMTSVEVTIVTTALPTIVSEFHGVSQLTWVFSMYLLTTAVAAPIFGKLSDQIGRKPIFIIGLIIFVVGSALCGIATNMLLLIIFRAVQGIGAGAITPIIFTIIADVFSVEKRANVMALNNMAWGISAMIGPLLGGFIVDNLSWHWIFFINVPLGGIVLLLVSIGYFESDRVKSKKLAIDYKGITAFAVVLISLLLGLQGLGERQLNVPIILLCFIVFIVAFILFIKVEKSTEMPLVLFNLFSSHTFTVQIATIMLLMCIQIGFAIYFPIWLQSIYQVSASAAGLALTPSSIMWVLASFSVAIIMKNFAPRNTVMTIVLIQMLFYLTLVFAGVNFYQFMFYIISGVTFGIITSTNTIVAQAVVSREYVGTASSMVTLGRTLGQTLMVGIYGLIFNLTLNQNIKKHDGLSMELFDKVINSKTAPNVGSLRPVIDTTLLSAFHNIYLLVVTLFVAVLVINYFDPMQKPLVAKNDKK
ncbi:MAG: MDR family MFS transporter [Micrococcaceae bacterium]